MRRAALLKLRRETLPFLILRCPAQPGLEGRTTVLRASRPASSRHLSMRSVGAPAFRRTLRRAAVIVGILALAACDDGSMQRQNRYGTYTPAALFRNDTEAQLPPAGTVAQGDLDRAGRVMTPPPVSTALLERGRQQFDVFCSPCHGATGRGDGMIVQRGFPAPPSYHTARLRGAPARYLFDVITNGYGVMYSYASRIEPEDRWAIVAYLRALQESQGARLADIPDARARLP